MIKIMIKIKTLTEHGS